MQEQIAAKRKNERTGRSLERNIRRVDVCNPPSEQRERTQEKRQASTNRRASGNFILNTRCADRPKKRAQGSSKKSVCCVHLFWQSSGQAMRARHRRKQQGKSRRLTTFQSVDPGKGSGPKRSNARHVEDNVVLRERSASACQERANKQRIRKRQAGRLVKPIDETGPCKFACRNK